MWCGWKRAPPISDAQGKAVSLLATVFYDWGSGVMVGETGLRSVISNFYR
jgi:gamma-glutamyltranspeptidase